MANANPSPSRKTSPATIAIAWLIVSIPALWGVTQTARTSAKLFRPAPTSTSPVKTTAPSH